MVIKKYRYGAYDRSKNFQEGELNAENEREAYIILQNQGLIAVDLKESETKLSEKIVEHLEKFKVGEKWVSLFFRQLSTTLDVMNLKDALNLFLLSTKDKSQQQIIKSMLEEIELGKTLAEAMEKHKSVFSYNVIQMILIAQRSGRMQEISEKLADRLEKNYKSRKKLQSALYYPLFVLIVAAISMTIIINVVLPTFATFFESQGTSLPLLTQIFMSTAIFISDNIMIIIMSVILIVIGCLWIYKNFSLIRLFIDRCILKMPFVGRLISQREWMNDFGSLSFLLESGVQIDESIDMVARSTSNHYIRASWIDIKHEVERGGQIHSKIFPPEYQGLITTGETSGTLPDMLRRCEMMSEFEVEELSSQIPIKAEIFGTLFVGLIVALIVFSVILPVLSIDV
ncbi:MAG: type II secretion system F family protein [Selenomonadaceae bacterium]|nr:type II secretion system F family protein [Selenomonadaceae bacterium]